MSGMRSGLAKIVEWNSHHKGTTFCLKTLNQTNQWFHFEVHPASGEMGRLAQPYSVEQVEEAGILAWKEHKSILNFWMSSDGLWPMSFHSFSNALADASSRYVLDCHGMSCVLISRHFQWLTWIDFNNRLTCTRTFHKNSQEDCWKRWHQEMCRPWNPLAKPHPGAGCQERCISTNALLACREMRAVVQ